MLKSSKREEAKDTNSTKIIELCIENDLILQILRFKINTIIYLQNYPPQKEKSTIILPTNDNVPYKNTKVKSDKRNQHKKNN